MSTATTKVLEVTRRLHNGLSPQEMAKNLASEGWQRKQGDTKKRDYSERGEDGKKIKDTKKGKSEIGEGVQRETSQRLYDKLGLKHKNINFDLFHKGVNLERKKKPGMVEHDLDKAAKVAATRLGEKPDSYKDDIEEGKSYGALIREGINDKRENPDKYCKHPKCLWRIKTIRGDNPCKRHPELAEKPDTKSEEVEYTDILQLDEKIHPNQDWHKNHPDDLMNHIYWLHGKRPPKDLKIRHTAYRGLVKQLHAKNPAPTKQALDRHMNHYINSAKKKLLGETVVSAAHPARTTLSADIRSDMAARKAKRDAEKAELMKSAKAEYTAATAKKEPSKAKRLAVSDMKRH